MELGESDGKRLGGGWVGGRVKGEGGGSRGAGLGREREERVAGETSSSPAQPCPPPSRFLTPLLSSPSRTPPFLFQPSSSTKRELKEIEWECMC